MTAYEKQDVGSRYPYETLPDGTVRKLTPYDSQANRPLQAPTCDELGRPLKDAPTSYMRHYPPTPTADRDAPFWDDAGPDSIDVDSLVRLLKIA